MTFSAWPASLDWGSVADWFTGLVTAGTLLIAVLILYQDRRSKNRADADGLATWQQFVVTRAVKGKAPYTVDVTAYNAGDRPIPFAIVIPSPTGKQQWPGTMLSLKPVTPGQSVTQEIGLEESWERTPLLLIFTDGRGRRWIRILRTNRYLTRREAKRLFRKWGPINPFNMLWDSTIKAADVWKARDKYGSGIQPTGPESATARKK